MTEHLGGDLMGRVDATPREHLEAMILGLEFALEVRVGPQDAVEVSRALERHLGLVRMPEPPMRYIARQLLKGWSVVEVPR